MTDDAKELWIFFCVLIGFLVALFGLASAIFIWSDSRDQQLPFTKFKLSDGSVVECRVVDSFRQSCAKLKYCRDGHDRCVQSYEAVAP